MTANSYVMTQRVLSRLEVKMGIVKCPICKEVVKVGEKVISKSNHRLHPKVYHEKCFMQTVIDI